MILIVNTTATFWSDSTRATSFPNIIGAFITNNAYQINCVKFQALAGLDETLIIVKDDCCI